MDKNELGVINYKIKSLQGKSKLTIESFIDGNIKKKIQIGVIPFGNIEVQFAPKI